MIELKNLLRSTHLNKVLTAVKSYVDSSISAFADAVNDVMGDVDSSLTSLENGKEDAIKNAAAKTTIVDADTIPLSDSAAASATKKITFANLKSTLKKDFLPLSGGTISGNVVISAGTSDQSTEPTFSWRTVGGNTPYIGFAKDQVDGTFILGSLKGTDYRSGLAIGGGSGNLLWKGVKVATAEDISGFAAKSSPTFTGVPKAPTAAEGTNTTQIATTAFVQSAVKSAASSGGLAYAELVSE